jgi:hypothetical protein
MDAESSHPKAAQVWIPGKCIPQALVAPKYVIKSTRIGEHTQFMRDHALIDKFVSMTLRKGPCKMDQDLVDSKRRLRAPAKFQRVLHSHFL